MVQKAQGPLCPFWILDAFPADLPGDVAQEIAAILVDEQHLVCVHVGHVDDSVKAVHENVKLLYIFHAAYIVRALRCVKACE